MKDVSTRSDLATTASNGFSDVESALRGREAAFAEFLAEIDGLASFLEAIGTEAPPQPRWAQDWFPGLDGAAAYTLTRKLKPRRIVEIGSGHSTRFLARAVHDGKLSTELVAIDPSPRAKVAGLKVEHHPLKLQEAEIGSLFSLQVNDFLFVDSSHILTSGSDVDVIVNGIVPSLSRGVVVHFHDMFFPDDYPASWAWRRYNEQQAVLPLITSAHYEILFSSHYARTRMSEAVSRTVMARLPLPFGAIESSLWARKV